MKTKQNIKETTICRLVNKAKSKPDPPLFVAKKVIALAILGINRKLAQNFAKTWV